MPCIFCEIVEGRRPAVPFLETPTVLGFMDIQPIRPGHVLVVPRDHQQRASDLPEPVASALWREGLRVGAVLREALPCDDVHYLLNDGPIAAQTVPHAHLHLVPRRSGDTLRLIGRILGKPFGWGMAKTDTLEAQAERIRAALNDASG